MCLLVVYTMFCHCSALGVLFGPLESDVSAFVKLRFLVEYPLSSSEAKRSRTNMANQPQETYLREQQLHILFETHLSEHNF